VAHLKLLIAKLKHDRFGASSERGSKLIDPLELELGELVTAASEDATKAESASVNDKSSTGTTPRRQGHGRHAELHPVSLDTHLSEERPER
jgi:transposase